nr:hypothetical protein [Tanacetum cinerariifolium]
AESKVVDFDLLCDPCRSVNGGFIALVIGGGVDVDFCGGGVKDGNDCGMTVENTGKESKITEKSTVRSVGVCWLESKVVDFDLLCDPCRSVNGGFIASVIGGGVDVDFCGRGVKDGNDCGMTVENTVNFCNKIGYSEELVLEVYSGDVANLLHRLKRGATRFSTNFSVNFCNKIGYSEELVLEVYSGDVANLLHRLKRGATRFSTNFSVNFCNKIGYSEELVLEVYSGDVA